MAAVDCMLMHNIADYGSAVYKWSAGNVFLTNCTVAWHVCDINRSGDVNAIDVQLVINAALGIL